MKRTCIRSTLLASFLAVMLGGLAVVACDDSNAVKEPLPDSGPGPGVDSGPRDDGSTVDGGGDAGPLDCVVNPKTHLEIINGCTNAVKITKNPVLPRLLPDGGLPPLN